MLSLAEVLADTATNPPPPVGGEQLRDVRHLLEGAARDAVANLPTGALPLRAPKSAVADAIRCARFAAARRAAGFDTSTSAAQRRRRRGVAADLLVAHLLSGGRLGSADDGTVGDGPASELVVDAWRARGDHDELAALESATEAERSEFRDDCDELAAALAAGWTDVDFSGEHGRWWPRTQTTAAIAPADGEVVVTMRPDAELGGPAARLPTVLIEVKANALSPDHTFDLNLYALAIAWRDGLAPAAVLHWSPNNGWVRLPPITADVLESAARRLAHALGVLGGLARGDEPEETPGVHCGWCPDAGECPSAAPDRRTASGPEA
ncbi:MAG: hypothetical protein R2704_00405 [Microthrixaceae bacterium]